MPKRLCCHAQKRLRGTEFTTPLLGYGANTVLQAVVSGLCTTTGSESTAHVMGMDYFFITKEGVKRRDELAAVLSEESEVDIAAARAAGKLIKCFMVRCMNSKNVFAHVVLQKGNDEDHFYAKLVVEDIK